VYSMKVWAFCLCLLLFVPFDDLLAVLVPAVASAVESDDDPEFLPSARPTAERPSRAHGPAPSARAVPASAAGYRPAGRPRTSTPSTPSASSLVYVLMSLRR
jgi:hypothetical protein